MKELTCVEVRGIRVMCLIIAEVVVVVVVGAMVVVVLVEVVGLHVRWQS